MNKNTIRKLVEQANAVSEQSFRSYSKNLSEATRHTLTASYWNKLFVDSAGVVWSPEAPQIVPASVSVPTGAVLINKPKNIHKFLMNITLNSQGGEKIVLSKYISSYDGGITNNDIKEKVGLRRPVSSSKVTTNALVKGAPTVSLNIGRPGADVIEQFYVFQDADAMVDLIVKNLGEALPDKNMVSAVNSFLRRGCDHMNWPPGTTDNTKTAITLVLSELIIGICLLKNTQFNLKDKPPFNDVADTFYLPVKSALSTIDFVVRMRNGNLLKFSSKVEEGSAAAFGPRLNWAVFGSNPNSFAHKATMRLMQNTRIGELIGIMKERGAKKIKESVYAYAFDLMGADEVDYWVQKTSQKSCDYKSIPIEKREKLMTCVKRYLATNSRISSVDAIKELLLGNLCGLSLAIRYIVADAINNDSKSQRPMMFVLRLFDYHQLNMNKSMFINTGAVKFSIKSFTDGTSKVNRVIIDPGKGTLTDTAGAYGFLNFRLQ